MTSEGMTRARRPAVKPTPLALMVLGLLAERPMHPYEMQRLMIERAKDKVINVQRGSLYPAVERLVKARLVEPAETSREGRRPERTTYQLTPDGRDTVAEWMVSMLRTPKVEYPEFAAALAFLPLVTHADALAALDARNRRLTAELAALEATLGLLPTDFPRLFLVETEYQLAMLRAEKNWVTGILDDLRSGRLAWDLDRIRAWSEQLGAAGVIAPPT
ncbi:Transcriptional regulator PadR-like family protein [Nakamurella panacisegetis]|uniref:Transcriptional regulator PadR-like family protein n=1 Tax=Nakamurella panacisegetis TaxID=1090615 RepID=A0A1H0JBF0_9ACTN|nr:PadR family transcriptional regulator [Nakamurella panacisegetis]SDO40880.1 Transcriptional regulator PadR-like family protein [Nakamurella panacisegetis]